MSTTTDGGNRRRSLESVVFGLGEALDAERASLFRVDERRRQLRIEVAHEEGGKALEACLPLDRGIVGHALATGETVRVENAYDDPRFCSEVDRGSGFHTRSVLAVPIRDGGGRVVAVIELLNRRSGSGFTAEDAAAVRAWEHQLRGLL